MNFFKPILFLIIVSACTTNKYDIPKYHQLVNNAELAICDGKMAVASLRYQQAFKHIDKPFGKDFFNAAIVAAEVDDRKLLMTYLQKLVNNLEDFNHLKSTFLKTYIAEQEWESLMVNRKVDFDPELKKEIQEVLHRDQLFRPDYDSEDSLIYANLLTNLKWIIAKTMEGQFPAQQELGFKDMLVGQNHHLVLHHATQRRSYDKNLINLETLLFEAVQTGRLDPQRAIQYMIYQNDDLRFQNFTVWQYKHALLRDSLKNIYWAQQIQGDTKVIDSVRNSWLACSFADAERKARYLSQNLSSPFIFSSVNKATGNFDESLNKDDALKTYNFFIKDKVPLEIKTPVIDD